MIRNKIRVEQREQVKAQEIPNKDCLKDCRKDCTKDCDCLFKISLALILVIQSLLITLIDYSEINYQRDVIYDNWKQIPIMDFNISDNCSGNQVNLNYTIPKIDIQCFCEEGYYQGKCNSGQKLNQNCQDVDVFDSQVIQKWIFNLRDDQIGLKMCFSYGNVRNYYYQLQNNKCFSKQTLETSPISSIQILRDCYFTKEQILANSIILERFINDPIIDVKIIYQNYSDNQSTIIDQQEVKQIWGINDIHFYNEEDHPHIYKNLNYTLVSKKYIKLTEQCDCSKRVISLFKQLNNQIESFYFVLYIQMGATSILLIINSILYFFPNYYVQFIFSALLSSSYVYTIYTRSSFQSLIDSLNKCFETEQIHSNINEGMLGYLVSICILNLLNTLHLLRKSIRQYRIKNQNVQTQPNSSTNFTNQQPPSPLNSRIGLTNNREENQQIIYDDQRDI